MGGQDERRALRKKQCSGEEEGMGHERDEVIEIHRRAGET